MLSIIWTKTRGSATRSLLLEALGLVSQPFPEMFCEVLQRDSHLIQSSGSKVLERPGGIQPPSLPYKGNGLALTYRRETRAVVSSLKPEHRVPCPGRYTIPVPQLKPLYHKLLESQNGGGSGTLTPLLVLTEDAHQQQCLSAKLEHLTGVEPVTSSLRERRCAV